LKRPPLIALTLGDLAGIGPEIAAKAALDASLRAEARLVMVGDAAAFESALRLVGRGLTLRRVEDSDLPDVVPPAGEVLFRQIEGAPALTFGRPSPETGRLAGRFIEEAVRLALAGKVSAIATCPLSKEWLKAGGYDFPGHTEMLAALTGAGRAVMLFAAQRLRVALATIHLPLSEVPRALSTADLIETLAVLDSSLRRDFALPSPRIAVCGLNPHAGEAGLFGREESEIIGPAIEAARERGINASGPHPADSLFPQLTEGRYECALAMYHDQGLIPVKLLDWRGAVNVTLGLPIVRTSPDHGTAFDIAGRGVADPTSLVNALRLAAGMARHRGA
jgi:4-hydroxythreonine-4-phosphate dehydrogenase